MEEAQPRRSSGRRKRKRRSPSYQPPYVQRSDEPDDMIEADEGDVKDAQATSRFSTQSIIIYYTLLFLKVGLWLVFAWILSHLHLGAPCFLLCVTLWLYSVPMHRTLHWAKRRLWGHTRLCHTLEKIN